MLRSKRVSTIYERTIAFYKTQSTVYARVIPCDIGLKKQIHKNAISGITCATPSPCIPPDLAENFPSFSNLAPGTDGTWSDLARKRSCAYIWEKGKVTRLTIREGSKTRLPAALPFIYRTIQSGTFTNIVGNLTPGGGALQLSSQRRGFPDKQESASWRWAPLKSKLMFGSNFDTHNALKCKPFDTAGSLSWVRYSCSCPSVAGIRLHHVKLVRVCNNLPSFTNSRGHEKLCHTHSALQTSLSLEAELPGDSVKSNALEGSRPGSAGFGGLELGNESADRGFEPSPAIGARWGNFQAHQYGKKLYKSRNIDVPARETQFGSYIESALSRFENLNVPGKAAMGRTAVDRQQSQQGQSSPQAVESQGLWKEMQWMMLREARTERQKFVQVICKSLQQALRSLIVSGQEAQPLWEAYTTRVSEAMAPWRERMNVYTLNDMLNEQQDISMALGLFRWAQKEPWYTPNVFLYTTLFGVMARVRDLAYLDELLDEMRADNVSPTVVTYGRLIYAYGKAYRIPEIIKLRAEMEEAGIQPTIIIFNTLMDCFCNAGLHHKVLETYKELVDSGHKPDSFVYIALLNSYEKANDLRGVENVFRQILSDVRMPSVLVYNKMISIYSKKGKGEKAIRLFQDMQDAGLVPDVRTYNIIINLCRNYRMFTQAEKAFMQMQENGVEPNIVSWNTLLSMWCGIGQLDKAKLLLRRMTSMGLEPDEVSYTVLLLRLIKDKKYDEALHMFRRARHCNSATSLKTYMRFLSSCGDNHDQKGIDTLIQCMDASGQPLHAVLQLLLLQVEVTGREMQPNDVDTELNELGRKRTIFLRALRRNASTANDVLPCDDRLVDLAWPEGGIERNRETWQRMSHLLDVELGSTDWDSRRAFLDVLVQFLGSFGWNGRAAHLWCLARNANSFPFPKPTPEAGVSWNLDLHRMSAYTALVAIITEMARLRDLALEGSNLFPSELRIVTGWGRHSLHASNNKRQVEDALEAMASPFRVAYPNPGCLQAPGDAVKQWLLQPGMDENLSFVDSPGH